jgi:hypothetical protein
MSEQPTSRRQVAPAEPDERIGSMAPAPGRAVPRPLAGPGCVLRSWAHPHRLRQMSMDASTGCKPVRCVRAHHTSKKRDPTTTGVRRSALHQVASTRRFNASFMRSNPQAVASSTGPDARTAVPLNSSRCTKRIESAGPLRSWKLWSPSKMPG